MTEVVVAASHEVGDATAGADARHHASAEGAESAQALLDVDRREVAEREGTDKLFLGILVFLGKDCYGLVAQMPWLPEPLLLITGIMAPPIRASHASAVLDMMCENMVLPKIPWLRGRSMVLPRQWP